MKDAISCWIDYYLKPKKDDDLFVFFKLLKKYGSEDLDLSGNPLSLEDEFYYQYPTHGLVQLDFKKFIQKENKNIQVELNKIALLLFFGFNFSELLNSDFKDIVKDVVEKAIISAEYELFDIKEDDLINKAISLNLISSKDRIHILFLRGMILGQRYPNKKAENFLKKQIIKNKLKTFVF